MSLSYLKPPHGYSKTQLFLYRYPKLTAYGSMGLLGTSAIMSSMTKGSSVLPWATFILFTAFMANRKRILRRAILKGTVEGALKSHTEPGLVEYRDIRPSLEGAFDIIYDLADTQCTGYLNSAWSELQTCFVAGKETLAGQCAPVGPKWGSAKLSRALADCAIYMNLMAYEREILECPAALQNYIAEHHPGWLAEYPQHFTVETLEPSLRGRLATAWFVHDTYPTKAERRGAMDSSKTAFEIELPGAIGGAEYG